MTYDGEDLKTYKDALGYKSTFSYDDNHKCIYCGKQSKYRVYFGKQY